LQVLQLAQIVIFSFSPILSKVYLQISPQDEGTNMFLGWAPFGYASNSSHKELRVLRQTAASEKQRHEEAEVFRP